MLQAHPLSLKGTLQYREQPHGEYQRPGRGDVIPLNLWQTFWEIGVFGPFALECPPEDDPQRFVLYCALQRVFEKRKPAFRTLVWDYAWRQRSNAAVAEALGILHDTARTVIADLTPDMRANLERTIRCLRRR